MSTRLRSVGGWLTLLLTFIMLAGLGANHFIHGPGCWGLQAGGLVSMRLYFGQIIVAGISSAAVIFLSIKNRHPNWHRTLFVTLVLASLSVWAFMTEGWTIFTTIHLQSIENLAPFFATTLTGVYSGLQLILTGKKPSRGEVNLAKCD